MSAIVDLIILMPGNHVPLTLTKKLADEIDAMLQAVLADETKLNQWLCFKDADGYVRRVNPRSIIGWYVRKHVQNTSEQAVAIMEKMEKKMPDPGEGDGWKTGE